MTSTLAIANFLKRIFDLFFALTLLLSLFPLLMVIGVLVKLDGGPLFYFDTRAGVNRIPFRVPKFRSMIVNANQYLDDAGCPTRDRVTPIGRFIRRFSIDELPQLMCVLMGSMSVVGPRPIMVEDADKLEFPLTKRFSVRPGLTGLAQVSGRNSLPWSKRFELDCEYVENFSLLNDFKIILKTASVVLSGDGMSMDRNPDQARR